MLVALSNENGWANFDEDNNFGTDILFGPELKHSRPEI